MEMKLGSLDLSSMTHFLLVLDVFMVSKSTSTFSPIDNYLLTCGSSQNVSSQGQVFVSDSSPSSLLQLNRGITESSNSTAPSPLISRLGFSLNPAPINSISTKNIGI
ncbi:hypothetical protein AMTRI_Chr03g52110 [Amborella trichopoda]